MISLYTEEFSLSIDFQKTRAAILAELRQFNGLGASFFRAAAARIGMTVTDMQVIDILDITGPMTAGQLAELTGLTTGAITGMINRLEETGLVRRERDPNDGRRVIVQLEKGKDHQLGPVFDSIGNAWDELVSHYDAEQQAFLLEFLKQSNAIARKEIGALRETLTTERETSTSLLGDLSEAKLIVSSGISKLTLRTDESMTELYQARFEGTAPEVKAKDGVVNIRYPRRLWVLGGPQRGADVVLNTTIPWQIMLQGGAVGVVCELGKLNLAGLEVKGGMTTSRLDLPVPVGTVPIKISGGASDILVRRPAGVATKIHLMGWASQFVFDDQTFNAVGNDVRLQSPNYDTATGRYDIEVSSSASTVTITTN